MSSPSPLNIGHPELTTESSFKRRSSGDTSVKLRKGFPHLLDLLFFRRGTAVRIRKSGLKITVARCWRT